MHLKIIIADSGQELENLTNEFLASFGNLILVKTLTFQKENKTNLLIFYTFKTK